MRGLFLISCFFLFSISLYAQESKPQKFRINGYVKDLQIFNFQKNATSLVTNNFVHNRINARYQPIQSLTFACELRNRFFFGEQVRLTPGFGKILDEDNGLVDMSFTYLDKPPVVFHTKIDRLFVDWHKGNWNVRLGRQRINWGINLAWNPNDIFNTYNFLDFDYEERPGTDAVKVVYQFKGFNSVELVVKPATNRNENIGALKYAFNKRGYDFQFFAGNYYRDVVLGAGWAGNIKNAGFKGEVSYFQGWDAFSDFDYTLVAATSFDYSFKKGWYINGSFLYNSAGQKNLFNSTALFSAFELTPKNLMPGKYSFLFQTMKPFTPLLTGSFSVIYSPEINLLILNPYIAYSIAPNWDIDLIVQSFFADNLNGKFDVLGNSVFLRLRWSFSN
jgi:hypothetical protein